MYRTAVARASTAVLQRWDIRAIVAINNGTAVPVDRWLVAGWWLAGGWLAALHVHISTYPPHISIQIFKYNHKYIHAHRHVQIVSVLTIHGLGN